MNDNKKIWPIKSETSCYLKWSWSTIFLTKGTTASCHRTVHSDIDINNFNNFHNTPKKLDDRKRMLAGNWPEESESDKFGIPGCTYCKDIEDHGGTSDRTVQLRHLEAMSATQNNILPVELLTDPTATEVTPTIIEVYFNNVCNMACLYCGPHFSTMWEEENRRFGITEDDGILNTPLWKRNPTQYSTLRDGLFTWLREHGDKIWNFGMLGGEPFFQQEFDMVLDHWENYPNPNLLLTIVSNLKIEHTRFVGYIQRLKRMVETGKIKKLNLSASLDCWGPPAEYIRWGLNLIEWEKNFNYLAQAGFDEWIVLNVNITITPLSIRTLPDLIYKLNELDKLRDPTRHICISFMHVNSPTQLNPLWFGAGVFTEDMIKVVDAMPTGTQYQRDYKEYMQGIANSIEQTPRNPAAILMLETYLNEMDQRRGTHWPELFPWLVRQFELAHSEI
jgi:hypothetical protein